MLSLDSQYDTAEHWSAAVITMDAFDVLRDRPTAVLLGMLWQNLAIAEHTSGSMWWGYVGEDIYKVCRQLHDAGYLKTIPAMRYQDKTYQEVWGDDATEDAARVARKVIIDLIYEVMNV